MKNLNAASYRSARSSENTKLSIYINTDALADALFKKHDRDQSRRLEAKELRQVLREVADGQDPLPCHFKAALDVVDSENADGTISLSQLKTLLPKYKTYLSTTAPDIQTFIKRHQRTEGILGEKEMEELLLVRLVCLSQILFLYNSERVRKGFVQS